MKDEVFLPLKLGKVEDALRYLWRSMVLRKRLTYIVGASFLVLTVVVSSLFVILDNHTSSPHSSGHQTNQKVALFGSLPPALSKATPVGTVNQDQQIQVSIALRSRDPDGLATLIKNQNDPKSSLYHKYLRPQDFLARFAPTQSSVDAVRAYLRNQGLAVGNASSNRLLISAHGTVKQINSAFSIILSRFKMNNREVFAPQQDPAVPQSIAGSIDNIGGLDNVAVIRPLLTDQLKHQTLGVLPSVNIANVINPHPIGGFAPNDLRTSYQVQSLINAGGNGATQPIAVFELTTFIRNDVTVYRNTYGLPNPSIVDRSVDGMQVEGDTSGESEADLDLQVVSAIAPNATQVVYAGPNTINGFNDTYNAFVTSDTERVMTTSWGYCEIQAGQSELRTLDFIFAQAAAQGQTIFAASGDSGSDDCYNRNTGQVSGLPPSVDAPASNPYVLGVGGTSVHYNFSTGTYQGETVWNNSNVNRPVATGGGVSSYFPRSPWQDVVGTNNPYAKDQREVPDVAALGDQFPGYSIYCSSTHDCGTGSNVDGWAIIGGTSGSAPLWAAVLTDINSYLQTNNKPTMGWAPPVLYQLYAYSVPNRGVANGMFNDITSGNNDVDYGNTPYKGDYPATPCFDLATGMGSPMAWNLAQGALNGVSGATGPCAPAAAPPQQLITNPGLDSPEGWTQYSANGTPALITYYHPHLGANSFAACEFSLQCDDRIWQNVSIPATVNQAAFRFWYASNSNFGAIGANANPPCAGHLSVTLATPDGTVIATIASYCSADTAGYVQAVFDVTNVIAAHAGQTLQLMFRGVANNIAYSNVTNTSISWLVDDVSLTVS